MSNPQAQTALVIAHEPEGPGGQLTVRLTERGFEVTTHVVTPNPNESNVARPFPAFTKFDLVAIMGSIRSLTEKEQIDTWVYDELDQIRSAHNQGLPILGICFGGQLIAEALGGSVEQAPRTELGWYEIDGSDGHVNPVGPGPWMQWHHDRFHPPPDATVLATTPQATQLFVTGRTVGTQFHPEVDVPHIAGWLSAVEDEYLSSYGQNRTDLLASMHNHDVRNTKQCHQLVDWFLDDIAF